ncbi:hypothetical protein [uncultured Ilyobacter sp.]|uniref:hypothetical protein n=1 Tax=uncultured Ilyobacter sp. TaxID=544433 RepID=UPI0029C93D4A|nr:hypothetical protein [uncultured Ilyobacter sp.]
MKRGVKLLRLNLERVFLTREDMSKKIGESYGIINLMLSDDTEIENWFLDKIEEFIPPKEFQMAKNLIDLARKADTSRTHTILEIDTADEAEKEYYQIYPELPIFYENK